MKTGARKLPTAANKYRVVVLVSSVDRTSSKVLITILLTAFVETLEAAVTFDTSAT